MKILNGKELSKKYRKGLKKAVLEFKDEVGYPPGLAVVIVGDNASSQIYVSNKMKACQEVGIRSFKHELSKDTKESEIRSLLETLNKDQFVHGILVQLPLPSHLSSQRVLSYLDPNKDTDALTVENVGLFFLERSKVLPCTPSGIMSILNAHKIDLEGKRAIVVGRSLIVGKPMLELLQRSNATVTLCHSRTEDLSALTCLADIVVVAAGKPRFLGRKDFKKGAVVIDVGIHRVTLPSPSPSFSVIPSSPSILSKKTFLCGDVRWEELEGWAYAATPVPGGVGPMTVTMLLKNTYTLATEKEDVTNRMITFL